MTPNIFQSIKLTWLYIIFFPRHGLKFELCEDVKGTMVSEPQLYLQGHSDFTGAYSQWRLEKVLLI